jgi:hypothetical protein
VSRLIGAGGCMPLMRALEQAVMPKIATANSNKMPKTLVFT